MNAHKTPPDPFSDPTSLGNVLIRIKKITREQLLQALGAQAQQNEWLLGALLVNIGKVDPLDVAKGLEIQAKMRRGDRAIAELDMLDEVLCETQRSNDRLAAVIREKKVEARDHGEHSGAFLRLVTG